MINEDGHWIYLLGMHPVYRHPAGDQRGFKLTIAQLVDCGACRQVEILTAFGISKSKMDRALRRYRDTEVRCLRKKLDQMAADGAAEKWLAALSRQWMEVKPEVVGTLYIDGHVRVYHGRKTKLPRKYVSRQRLCLRGTTDYWVNDMGGLPYFVIDKVVDSGLLDALRADIVPRLLKDVPGQPTAA